MKFYLKATSWLIMWMAATALAGDVVQLSHYPFEIGQPEPEVPVHLRLEPSQRGSADYYLLIHLKRTITSDIRSQLEARGIQLLNYIPSRTYLVRVSHPSLLDSVNVVDWWGWYHPAYKIDGFFGHSFQTEERRALGRVVDVTLHPGSSLATNQLLLENLGGEVLSFVDAGRLQRLAVRISDFALVETIALINDVAWVSERGERMVRNDNARWIAQSYKAPGPATMATPLYDNGLDGTGHVIGLIDNRVDIDHCLFTDSEEIVPGPNHRKFVYFDDRGAPIRPHGTHVAGTLAGFNEDGTIDMAGLAYGARIAFTLKPGPSSGEVFNIFSTHAAEGAFIHSNSWGSSLMEYTIDCVDVDTFTWMNEDALVVFAAENDSEFPLGPLRSPENSINVLAVGATEVGSGPDPELVTERHGSCVRGPTIHLGRRKPEIFAPGCGLISAEVSTACDGWSLCGTSMATPITSAGATLVRQYFVDGYYPHGRAGASPSLLPSGALLKAMLLNGTVDMSEETENMPGVFTDTPIPNNIEGWGRLHLDQSLFFPGDCRRTMIEDIPNGQGLSTTETFTTAFRVGSSDEELRVTMVFTAPPAPLMTFNPVINDLDLRLVAPDGVTVWLGNVFSGGVSATGGFADPLNNVEQIRIPAPPAGIYTLEVEGREVNMDTQGFALVISGDLLPEMCADFEIHEPDVTLACWGEKVDLGQSLPCNLEGSVSWSPSAGLSDPNTRAPVAQPTHTTTYTVTVDLPGGCQKEAQVTITVPPMDLNGDEALNATDLLTLLGNEVWDNYVWFGTLGEEDFNHDDKLDVRDLVLLQNCISVSETF